MKFNLLTAKCLGVSLAILAGCCGAGIAQARQQIAAPETNAGKTTVRRHLFGSPTTRKSGVRAENNDSAPTPLGQTISTETNLNEPVFNVSRAQTDAAANPQIEAGVDPIVKPAAAGGDSGLSVVASTQIVAAGGNESSANNLSATARIGSAKIRNAALSATEIYRANTGDVLDVRLLNAAARRESTLYTILEGGLIDYPLAGEPLAVAGMTIEEIGELLAGKIKLFDRPEIVVTVRDFGSHKVAISGLVDRPGVKFLRREAVPLFAILAEALQQPEARTAEIIRANKSSLIIDLHKLTDDVAVQDGDVVRILGKPDSAERFYFIGNFVAAPGEKNFHAGITLTQAILAAGGAVREGKNKIVVSRQNSAGLLVKTEFNLKQIKNGKIPDPPLQPDDRIEIAD